MAGLPLLDDESALTVDWMASALNADASGCRLAEVAIEPLGAGEIAKVLRCRLTWADRTPGAPAPDSVIVKLPSADRKTRQIAKRMGMYKQEYEFYKSFQKETPIRSPALLYGDYEAKSERFVLVLEDLCSMEQVDQIVGANAAQAQCAIRAAAGLHGRFWGRTDQPSIPNFNLDILRPEFYRPVMCVAFLAAYARGLELFGSALPKDRRRSAEACGPKITDFIRCKTIGPRTFVHGDFRIDNLLFGTNGDDFAAVDWQTSKLSSGLYDVAYFLVGSVPAKVRRAIERDILEEYHGIVCSTRGENANEFTFAECWQLYRKYVGVSIFVNAMLIGRLPLGSARGRQLAEVVLERSLAAMEDLEAEGFLAASGWRWNFAKAFSSLCRSGYRAFRMLR